MASRCAPWSGHLLLKKAALSLLALSLAVGVRAQPGAPGALPPLPAVQDEGAADPTPPASPAPSPAAATAPAEEAAEEAAPAETPIPPGRFSSEADARASLRAAFASHDYSAVLGMVDDVRKQFPNASFARYYETMARLQMRDHTSEPGKLPYKRLESIPPAEVRAAATPAPSPRAAVATPAPTPAPTPDIVPAAMPTATPVATPALAATVPTPAPKGGGSALDDVIDTITENPLYVAGGAGGALALGLAVWLVRRRRRAAEEAEEEADLFALTGAPALAPAEPEPLFGGMMLDDDEIPAAPEPPAPPSAPPVFRSEVQAQALAGGALAYGPSRPLFGREPEAAPAPAPEPEPQSAPFFSFAELQALQAERSLRAAPAEPEPEPELPLAAQDSVFADSEISFDSFVLPEELSEPEPPARAVETRLQPPLEDDDSLLVVAEQQPDIPEERIGESLYIDDISKFEFPTLETLETPAAPEAALNAFALDGAGAGLTLDSPGLGALDTRPEPARTDPSPEFTGFSRDEVALAGEETQTGTFGEASAEETLISPEPGEPAQAPLAPPAMPDFTAFRADETVVVRMPAEPAPEPEDERTRMSPPPEEQQPEPKQTEEKRGKAWIVEQQSEPEDVFEREYRQGLIDAEAHNWVGAIHHLSIAAALRPSAMEVKEKLREARRMRAKELEGRG